MGKVDEEWTITAELARLEFNEAEKQRLSREAERMRKLFLTMEQADVDHLEPTTHAQFPVNRVRTDAVRVFGDVEALMEASPESEDEFFLIPHVL